MSFLVSYLLQNLFLCVCIVIRLTTNQKEEIVNLKSEFSDSYTPSKLVKPVFLGTPKGSKEVESLIEFVKLSSWLFFQAIQCNGNFLRKPVQKWSEDDEYKKAKEVVDHKLVKDCAERAIKLSSDFQNSFKKEETYQSNLHIKELNRKESSN